MLSQFNGDSLIKLDFRSLAHICVGVLRTWSEKVPRYLIAEDLFLIQLS